MRWNARPATLQTSCSADCDAATVAVDMLRAFAICWTASAIALSLS